MRDDAELANVLMLDVDGVLVNGRPRDGGHPFTDLEADLGISPEILRTEFFTPYWEAIVTGREPILDRLTAVLARIAPNLRPEALLEYWFENDSRIDPDVLSAVQYYRGEGVRVFLATNQEHRRASYLMNRVGLAASVDGILYSAALGHRKPSAEFYRLAAEKAAATPQRIIFVDDALPNIEAARQSCWRAVHWTGETGLGELLAPHLGT